MNRRIFYFDKSSIEKACEHINEMGKSDAGFNISQLPGYVDTRKSGVLVEASDPIFMTLLYKAVMEHDWKSAGIFGFSEDKLFNDKERFEPKPLEPEPKPFMFFSCKTGAEADLIASTARHRFINEIENGKFSIEKTVSQRDKSKTYIRARSDKQEYRDAFNDFMNNFGWETYGMKKPEMQAVETSVEREVEIKFVSLGRLSDGEAARLGSLSLSAGDYLENKQGIQTSKFESVKPPADFCGGTAEMAMKIVIDIEDKAGFCSDDMNTVLENAKKIYDFLKGVSSHFVDGKSLGGEKNAR